MYPNIEVIEIGLLDLKVVDSPISDQHWGFLLQPNLKEEGVNLRIRFELLLPINNKQHIFCKTITGFFLENFNSDYLKNETETITGLIQTAMANTRLLVMQKFKKFDYVQMRYFDNKLFLEELKLQIKELNL